MTETGLTAFLAGATIEDAVLALRPDDRALLLVVDGLFVLDALDPLTDTRLDAAADDLVRLGADVRLARRRLGRDEPMH